jgi:broad specificity phosphatase PhoE
MAQAFAQAYASMTGEAIYTSPMLRARQTADPLSRLTGVPTTLEDGLKEIGYGEWEGLRQEDVKQRWPELSNIGPTMSQAAGLLCRWS